MPTGSLFCLFFPLPIFPVAVDSFHLDLLQRWISRPRFIPGWGSIALLSFLSIVCQHNVDAIVDLVQVPLALVAGETCTHFADLYLTSAKNDRPLSEGHMARHLPPHELAYLT